MEQREGQQHFIRRQEGSAQWNGPPLELFPSRNYGGNGMDSPQANRAPTPMAAAAERYNYRMQPTQEVLRSPSGNIREVASSNLHPWENMPPPMSSAPDRLLDQQRRGGYPQAQEVSQSTREWVSHCINAGVALPYTLIGFYSSKQCS